MAQSKLTKTDPERAMTTVRRISLVNGWSVAVVAGLFSLIALAFGDLLGAVTACLVVVAGGVEVFGNRRLKRRDASGMTWLIRSQLFLMTVVLVYAVTRIASFDGELALANMTPDMQTALQEAGINPEDVLPMVRLGVWILYGAVAMATCVYQGGLALFYRVRTPLIENAIAAAPHAGVADGTEVNQEFYDAVAVEMAANQFQPGLWARALAESDGHEARCKAIYIRLRVAELVAQR